MVGQLNWMSPPKTIPAIVLSKFSATSQCVRVGGCPGVSALALLPSSLMYTGPSQCRLLWWPWFWLYRVSGPAVHLHTAGPIRPVLLRTCLV